MHHLGVLAFGSLLDSPGDEIARRTITCMTNVETPFNVEFARSSRSREGAPTLIPVSSGGSPVRGTIFVLGDEVSADEGKNILWRRETYQLGSARAYQHRANPGPDTVVIEILNSFHGVDSVLYTRIASNIHPLSPRLLADLAIASARGQAGCVGRDGIRYLKNAKQYGIRTPLMPQYEREILKSTGAANLEQALERVHVHQG